jgi:hypothetical protein
MPSIVENIEHYAFELKDESSIILNGGNVVESARDFLNNIINRCDAILERRQGHHIFMYVYSFFGKCGTSISQMKGRDTPRFRANFYSLVWILHTIGMSCQADMQIPRAVFLNRPEINIPHSTLKCAAGKSRNMPTLHDDVMNEIRTHFSEVGVRQKLERLARQQRLEQLAHQQPELARIIQPTPQPVREPLSYPRATTRPEYRSLPQKYHCPICTEPFLNPVLTSIGNIYCEECVTAWLQNHDRDPTFNIPVTKTLVPALITWTEMNEYKITN